METILNTVALKANQNIAAREYWKERLNGVDFVNYYGNNLLPLTESRETLSSQYTQTASNGLFSLLNACSSSEKGTFIILLATAGILSMKYSEMEDVVLLTTNFANDNPSENQFIPVRINGNGHFNFPSLVNNLKAELFKDFKHSGYPIEKIIAFKNQGGKHLPTTAVLMDGLQTFPSAKEIVPDILFNFNIEGMLSMTITYESNRFDRKMIERLPLFFFELLEKLLKARTLPLDQISLISPFEQQLIIDQFNNTDVDYNKNDSIVSLFEECVAENLAKPAIEEAGLWITYEELNDRTNQLAYYLLEKGVGRDQPIGVMMDRSIDFIVAVFAILKTGNSYVPIDPRHPIDRINYMLDAGSIKYLLSHRHLSKRMDRRNITTVCIDQEHEDISKRPSSNPPRIACQNVYLMFTSGSTGQPKGVWGTQKGLLNRLNWGWKDYSFDLEEVGIQKTSISFVDHVAEIFSPLLKGFPLTIFKDSEQTDVFSLLGHMQEKCISRITLVPSLLSSIIQAKRTRKIALPSLKRVFCSGEVLSFDLASDFFKEFQNTSLVNIYGSTEVSADVTSFLVDKLFRCNTEEICCDRCDRKQRMKQASEKGIPIGKPISNTKILIVDNKGLPVPVGVPGEITVSGPAVTSDILSNSSSNANLFTNVFFPELRTFRTGDRGRWLADGNIEYLGRTDHQVKIRGFRINLNEINHVLSAHTKIDGAVIAERGEGLDRYLCLYFVSHTNLESSELRQYLKNHLPDYMIPSHFIRMDKLPLNSSGKVDKSALPEVEKVTGKMYQPPIGSIEKKLTEIWSEILKMEKTSISVEASFFELGGFSLRAISLVNKINLEFGVEISIKEVFAKKTIRKLATLLRISSKSEYAQLKKAEVKPFYDLSIAQLRVYYFYELDHTSLTFNMPEVIRLTGVLDKERLEGVFQKLIQRHNTLHTGFRIVDDRPMQFVSNDFKFNIELFYAQESEVDDIVKKFIRPFDLRTPPLIRVGLIQTAVDTHFMMIDMHHIASDGTSIGILIRDFMAYYNDVDLPPLEIDYKDYAVWQQSPGYQKKIAKQKEFWISQFAEPIVPLDIPTDFINESNTKGDSLLFELGFEETRKLRAIAESLECTISMVITSLLSILLSKISNQNDIVVGMAVAGREQNELENIVGMFPVVLPLRTHPAADLTYRDFLLELKGTFLATLDNQSFQYEELAKEINLDRNTTRNPWFDVMYLYQNFDKPELSIPNLSISLYKEQNIVAHEKLNLTVVENEGQILLRLVYSEALFKRASIERFADYFKQITKNVTADIDRKIASIEIITTQQRNALLQSFNTGKETKGDGTFLSLFKEQVLKTPDNCAVEHNGMRLTYKELNLRAINMASQLQQEGIQKNKNVALLLPRGIDLLTSIVAIFYAGGAYVPIDPEFPQQRIEEILLDSEPGVLLTTQQLQDDVKRWIIETPLQTKVLTLEDKSSESLFSLSEGNPNDLAYIIYTSGTTGKPKGAMIHQLGMVNHLLAMIEILSLNENDVIAQTASPCFDISVWQFLTALLTGGTTRIVDKEKLLDAGQLLDELHTGGITVLQSVPSLMNTFLNQLPENHSISLDPLRWMIPTGEPLSVSLATRWYSNFPLVKLLNAYGPAEASDDVTCGVVTPPNESQSWISIGKPIRNTHVYILDTELNLCPPGVKGEICIAGLGIGKGYWRDEKKTNALFVPNPFPEFKDDPFYSTIYKSGDIGYYLEDGSIVCLGRKDDQVKIRGFRIELTEIETRLSSYLPISNAVVIVLENNGDKHLVAYYVSSQPVSQDKLEQHLSSTLPHYMIPTYFVHLDSLPLTLNGKLDKRKLPKPEIRTDLEYVHPSGETEFRIQQIWSELLRIDLEKISTATSFFSLGGHSLSAMTFINRIHKEFNINVSLKDFFSSPTIQSIAQIIDARLWLQNEVRIEDTERIAVEI